MMFSRMPSALFALAALATVTSAELVKRDTWSPKVLTPNQDTPWFSGTRANVTWDTSNPPEVITGGTQIQLRRGGSNLPGGPGSASDPLAKDFDLRNGFVEVTVPYVVPADDYQVVLFGSSDNFGPYFSIV